MPQSHLNPPNPSSFPWQHSLPLPWSIQWTKWWTRLKTPTHGMGPVTRFPWMSLQGRYPTPIQWSGPEGLSSVCNVGGTWAATIKRLRSTWAVRRMEARTIWVICEFTDSVQGLIQIHPRVKCIEKEKIRYFHVLRFSNPNGNTYFQCNKYLNCFSRFRIEEIVIFHNF